MMNCSTHEDRPATWMVDLFGEDDDGSGTIFPYCEACTDILVETRIGETVQTVSAYENLHKLMTDARELAERDERKAREAAAIALSASPAGVMLMPEDIQEIADNVIDAYLGKRHTSV